MNTPLVSEEVLQRHTEQILLLIEDWDQPTKLIRDEQFGVSLRYFQLFSLSQSAIESVLPGITPLQAFYNRYYWFCVLSRSYQRQHGFDAGFQQQEDDFLTLAPDGVDWSVVEEVGALAGSVVATK